MTKETRRGPEEKQERGELTIANICISRWDDGIHDEILWLLKEKKRKGIDRNKSSNLKREREREREDEKKERQLF